MKITRVQLLALALGACLLIAVPLRAEDEYEEVPDDEEDAGTDEPSEDDVVVMTDSNFDDLIKKHKFALVEFYAPWCGHCKKLAPEYAAAATALKQHDASVLIGKVDATEQTELAAKFSIQGYPTLKWFVEGEVTDYEGGRTTEAIVGWVKKKTGPPAETVDSVDRIAELEKENEVVVVGYFSKLEGEDFDIFLKVAQKIDDVAFVQTTNADVAKTAQITTAPGVGVIKNFKTETSRVITVLNEKLEKPLLEGFIKAEKIPLIVPFNKETQPKIFGSGIDKHILIIAPSSLLEAKGEVLKAVKAAAEEHKGALMFVTAALDEEDGKAVAGFFDVPEDSTEAAIVGFFMEKRKKYKMDGKVTEEAVKAFAAGVADGTAPATYKSEEIPEEPEDGGVTVVVGKNFDAIVKDPKKDVLLEIYAPWCGHCKSLAPTYKKLAKRFKPVDSVVIAKMDGTANEHEDADAQGFPTLIFFPAEEGATPIPYEGDRSLLDMTKFIKKNANIPYELQKKPKKGAAEDGAKDEL